MAFSARSEADCKEFFDDEATLKLKIRKLAELIRNSKHFCAFTGAGISTAAGIADFRSGINTVLDTGTGVWAARSARNQGKSKQIKRNKKATRSIKAVPTASHMALVSLMTTGPKYLKCLISQNTDGLHRRSGIPIDRLCELHGNTTLEVCDKCGRGYMRDYRCRNSLRRQKVTDHRTGRHCTVPRCGGNLCDTIINFGEELPERTLEDAQKNTTQCDVMLALGSSLTVTPAADLPREVGERWADHLVIVNLQKTPLDDECSLRIFAKIDDVMVPLMKELALQIPEWRLQRFMKVEVKALPQNEALKSLTISAVDVDGFTATVFEDVKLRANGKEMKRVVIRGNVKKKRVSGDEFTFHVPSRTIMASDDGKEAEDGAKGLEAELSFFGNYAEPNLCVPISLFLERTRPKDALSPMVGSSDDMDSDGGNERQFVCRLLMDIATKQWTVETLSEDEVAALRPPSAIPVESEDETKDHGTDSMDDVLERAERVQREFASMKHQFRRTITALGAQIQIMYAAEGAVEIEDDGAKKENAEEEGGDIK